MTQHDRILHGEQYTEIVRPLPLKQKLTHKAKIKEIWDKGSEGGKKGGAVIVTSIDTFDEDGNLLVKNEISTFAKGCGGWGGDRGPDDKNVNVAPDRAPDKTVEQQIHKNQALLYRLSGDWNPLHADPGFAQAFGFPRPILHGLCTFGYVGRHVIKAFCGGDPRKFKSIKTRFAESVFPGETLQTEMWKVSDTRVLFRCKVVERNVTVITGGAVELWAQVPAELPAPAPAPVQAAPASAPAPVAAAPAPAAPAPAPVAQEAAPTAAQVFEVIAGYVKEHPELVGQIKTSYQWNITEPASAWIMDLKNGAGEVKAGTLDDRSDVNPNVEVFQNMTGTTPAATGTTTTPTPTTSPK